MVSLLIGLIVILLVFALIWAAFRYIPLPDPFHWVVPAVLLLILALILFTLLWPMTGLRLP